MSDTGNSLPEEDINIKFQELKDKVTELKERNKTIESRLDALDGDQSFCPLCQRQDDEEAIILKKLEARVKDLEVQEKYRDEEIDKLQKSLNILIQKFDRLINAAQGFCAKSKTNTTGTENTAYSLNRKIDCDQNVSQTYQNVPQTSSQNVPQTVQNLPQADLNAPETNQYVPQTVQNVPQTVQKVPQTVQKVLQTVHNVSQTDQNVPQTDISHSGSGSIAISESGPYKSSTQQKKLENIVNDFKRQRELKLQGEVNVQSDLFVPVPKREVNVQSDLFVPVPKRDFKEGINFMDHFLNTQQNMESSCELTNDWSEKISNFIKRFDTRQRAGGLCDVRRDSKAVDSTGEKLLSPVKNQNPVSHSKVSPEYDRGIIKGDNSQKTEDLQSVSIVEDTSKRNFQKDVKFVGGGMNFTKSKHQDLPKTEETSESVHNSYHRKDQEADVNIRIPSEMPVDLDLHLPVSRVFKSYWSEIAQIELDESLKNPLNGAHTMLCIDTSASMRKGTAWQQTQEFVSQFIQGMDTVRAEFNIDEEYVAFSIFGQEVRVIQRLTNSFSLLKHTFSSLKLGGPSPMYGGLLMALAGVVGITTPTAVCIKLQPRIILVTDGHPTQPLISSGPDVFDADDLEKIHFVVMEAVFNIKFRGIQIHCVPVGDADVSFLEYVAANGNGKVYSYKDGRKLARKTINTINAGHLIKHWKMLNDGRFGMKTVSLEDVMHSISKGLGIPFTEVIQMARLSDKEKKDVVEIAKEALEKGLVQDDENGIDKYHYESDNPNSQLPPLGKRVRRGPDWDNDLQDGNGPGTIIGHHRKERKVNVEWDKTGASNFYCYGYLEKYDVIIMDEPRVLKSDELIATGCLVKRGKDWKYSQEDGTPGAEGVVIKVLDDGRVLVRWPNKKKNIYRFGADGCFDLEIGSAVENQTDLLAQFLYQSGPHLTENLTLNQSSTKSTSKNENVSKKSLKKNKNA